MTKVKICGLRDVTTALCAARSGADYIGLVFAPSRRQLDPKRAKAICKALYKLDNRPQLVGVFVNEEAARINSLIDQCGLDTVQLSGNEDLNYCHLITKPIIKTIRVMKGGNTAAIAARVAEIYSHGFSCLLDTGVEGKYGGTGKIFNWQQVAEMITDYPIIIAGGLSPGNVGQLISEFKPWGVDVSGGVETVGNKDRDKIKAFINAVKRADEYGETSNEDA